jgi:hypothetical protein
MKKFSESVSTSNFKLSIDVHGVIDDLPEFFSFLTQSIVSSGGEVHIVTGGSLDDNLMNLIKDSGVKWTHIFSVYDYLMSSEEEINGVHKFLDGTSQKRFKDEVWNRVKGDYCKKNNISLHIDDTLAYGDYFTTPFAKLFSKK